MRYPAKILTFLLVSASPIIAMVPDIGRQGQINKHSLDSVLEEMRDYAPLPIIKRLTDSAEKGDPSAQFVLAVLYDKGIHVNQDKERASQLIKLSAEGGYPEAMYVVAEKYDSERNYSKAFEWYRKASETGEPKSMQRLSEMYRDGKGIGKDLSLFFSWVRQSAYAGNAVAQYDLSLAYLKGDGCKQDLPRAYAWIKISAENGHKKAVESIMKYEQNMTADDIQEGERIYLEINTKLTNETNH